MNKWICPNDRQLALRAQLGTGWSFFTNRQDGSDSHKSNNHNSSSASGSSPSNINNEELAHIADVLQRKEKCDKIEQERIGHMVVHLESIKQGTNAAAASITTQSSKNCHICGSNMMLIIIYPRRRKTCDCCGLTSCDNCCVELCLDGTMISLSKNNESLAKRAESIKQLLINGTIASLVSSNSSSSNSGSSWSSSSNAKIRICKYCIEIREIWKRSGAWQYKELPQYSLPRNNSVCPHPNTCSRVIQTPLSSTKVDSASWETYRKPPRWSTINDSQSDNEELEEQTTTTDLAFERFSFNPFEADTGGIEENNLDNVFNVELNDKAVPEIMPNLPDYVDQSDKERYTQAPPVGSKFWSKESIQRKTKKHRKDYLGTLCYKIYHDSDISQLIVTIESAKDLKAMDSNGLSDPYVKCHLLPGHSHKTKLRTKTCYKTLNPVWNESLIYHGIVRSDMESKTLRLAVLDEDTIGFDWIGEYRLYLADVNSDEEYLFSHDLLPRQPIEKDSEDLIDHERGKILISLLNDSKNKTLRVCIIRCAELAPMDTNGFSDPFCKIYLKPDRLRLSKRKTQTKKMTLNPYFNEEFIIEVDENWNKEKTLEISVWDYDRGPTNDFIGGVRLHYRAKGDRGKLWRSLSEYPNKRFEGWFILCADLRDID